MAIKQLRAMIVVTRHPTLQGVYQIQTQGVGARPGRRDVSGAEAAAAQAMNCAIQYGRPGYHVFAPSEVSKHIPDDMKSKQ